MLKNQKCSIYKKNITKVKIAEMNVMYKRRAILKSTQCKKNMNMATFAKLRGNELKYSIMNTCTFCKSDFLTRSE